MDSTLLELKMTNNFQQQIQALNDAERNIRAAEIDIETLVETAGRFDFNTANDGYYDSTSSLVDVHGWKDLSPKTGVGDDGNTHQYIVEYLGKKTLPGESMAEQPDGGIPGDSAYAYIVTARSKIGTGATRTVQAAYTTFEQP